MKIEGTITQRTKFGRMSCLQIGNDHVFVNSEVFEDLASLRVGVEIEVECFKNEKDRLIATAVQVLRCTADDVTEEQMHDGLTVFQANQSDAAELGGMTDRVDWRYRKQT
ncbi:hypothetical protein LCGC14_0916450 [marine sediment metagenome]|uniref:Uncharacterized protein n=1 Tax=marine sediment metagenome TaxID=412755 RepID=A0A0F9NS59_9ZZZZ